MTSTSEYDQIIRLGIRTNAIVVLLLNVYAVVQDHGGLCQKRG